MKRFSALVILAAFCVLVLSSCQRNKFELGEIPEKSTIEYDFQFDGTAPGTEPKPSSKSE